MKVERVANKGEDYANFILHCRYFGDPSHSKLSYYYARKSIRHKEVPLAVLRLGILYAMGIGTTENHTLANYFYEMALTMGCNEAEYFIDKEFESGRRNIIEAIERAMGNNATPSPCKLSRYKKWIDRERMKKNYGYLTRIREYLPVFYPEYDEERAFDDILNNRDTVDADICYSLSTSDNLSEVSLDTIDSLLQQLYAPVTDDKELYTNIIERGDDNLFGSEESELIQCIIDLTSSYNKVCKKYGVEKKDTIEVDTTEMFPYFNVYSLSLWRKQAFRCLLSLRSVDPEITSQYLNNLVSDADLLDICEKIEDQDLKSYLISYVELNLDVNIVEEKYQELLLSYRDHCFDELASHLNDFVGRLTDSGFEHHLPIFNPTNLPQIELT